MLWEKPFSSDSIDGAVMPQRTSPDNAAQKKQRLEYRKEINVADRFVPGRTPRFVPGRTQETKATPCMSS